MPEHGKISIRQFTILVIFVTIGDSILILPYISSSFAKQDTWISGIVGLLVGLLAVYIFSMLGNLYPKLTLIQSIQKILGKWFGTLIAALFLLYPLITVVAYTRELGDFITTEMMAETPTLAVQILFTCIVIFAVRLGLEVIARTGEIFLPCIILLFLLLVIFLSPQAKMENLLPILENGIKPILHGSLSFIAFPFLELFVFIMIFPYINQVKPIRRGFLQGALLGGIVLIILVVISILVLGADVTSRTIYPSYSLARRVSIGQFFERMEAMVALLWMLTIFMKTTFYFYVFTLGLAQLLKLKGYRMLTLPTGFLIIILSPIISPNITYYNKVLAEYWPYFVATCCLLLPLFLLAIHFIKNRFKQSNET
ncbi:GerAB/ArcD/ProY family transporter [Paenibacillus sp. FA6]|uniref:GerAB/ArcD/ProY family transporter n=1 Tax=Paenibacillus sp. FA6 TaxID=3413029 RepID=UPI003F65CE76